MKNKFNKFAKKISEKQNLFGIFFQRCVMDKTVNFFE